MAKWNLRKAVHSVIALLAVTGFAFSLLLANSWRFIEGFSDYETIFILPLAYQVFFLLLFLMCVIGFLFRRKNKTILVATLLSFLLVIFSTYSMTISLRVNSISTSILGGFVINDIPLSEHLFLNEKWYGYSAFDDTENYQLLVNFSPLFNQAKEINGHLTDLGTCKESREEFCSSIEISWP